MLQTVSQQANFLATVKSEATSDIKGLILPTFDNQRSEPIGGYSVASNDFKEPTGGLATLLLNFTGFNIRKAAVVTEYYIAGTCYTAHKQSAGNSHIAYKHDSKGFAFARVIGIILYIQRGTGTVMAAFKVLPFHSLSRTDTVKDPYQKWRNVAGELCHEQPGAAFLLPSADVIGHASFRPYETGEVNVVHLMPLNKVRFAGSIAACQLKDICCRITS